MPRMNFSPPIDAKKWTDRMANTIDDPMRAEDRGTIRPLLAGGIQGIGDVISGMSSPEAMVGIGAAPNIMRGASGALRSIGGTIAEGKIIPAIRDEAGRLIVPERRILPRPPGPWDANIGPARQEPINPEDIMMQKIRERFNMGQPMERDPTIGRGR